MDKNYLYISDTQFISISIMKRYLLLYCLFSIIFCLYNCSEDPIVEPDNPNSSFRIALEASSQREGDATKGWDYLVNGEYVSSGIPYDLHKSLFGDDTNNVLDRSGDNASLAPEFTSAIHSNGEKIVAPNCLTCHAQKLNNQLIVGLGNNSFNYADDLSAIVPVVNLLVSNTYGIPSKQWDAYERFSVASEKVNMHTRTKVRGVNPADQLTAVLVAHRDPETLEWIEEPQLEIPMETVPTDVPAWWLLKKKHTMFYTGIGRGDFSKFLMASSLLTLQDTTEAQEIDAHFVDVLAWINELEAPEYPEEVDNNLVAEGRDLFDANCASCHGKYDGNSEYPNLLISTEEVKTDATLAEAYKTDAFGSFVSWYNSSWFSKGEHAGKLVVEPGYVAPPLDGIWATAPYLHNGSIPDLESLLDSSIRPSYWKRSYTNYNYDLEKVGWPHEILTSKEDVETYDTTLPGYGNGGHTYGDLFSSSERLAVIEYLKTL